MSDVVSPPATDAWWDVAETKAVVCARLRIADDGTDIDDDVVDGLIPIAGHLVNVYIDRVSDTTHPDYVTPYVPSVSLKLALQQVTIDLYRDPSVIGAGGAVVITEEHPVAQTLRALARPSKERWGIG